MLPEDWSCVNGTPSWRAGRVGGHGDRLEAEQNFLGGPSRGDHSQARTREASSPCRPSSAVRDVSYGRVQSPTLWEPKHTRPFLSNLGQLWLSWQPVSLQVLLGSWNL